MRIPRVRPWVAVLVVFVALVAYIAHYVRVDHYVAWLASQPQVTTAFQHPHSGKTDALTTLLAFAVLTPIAVFFLVIAFLLLVNFVQTLFDLVHLPKWLCLPVVGIASVAVVYQTSGAWLAPSLYALGLIARAYLVYFEGGAAAPIARF